MAPPELAGVGGSAPSSRVGRARQQPKTKNENAAHGAGCAAYGARRQTVAVEKTTWETRREERILLYPHKKTDVPLAIDRPLEPEGGGGEL